VSPPQASRSTNCPLLVEKDFPVVDRQFPVRWITD
jgi:hypothetical protein